jgi:hypothetical protein
MTGLVLKEENETLGGVQMAEPAIDPPEGNFFDPCGRN